MQSFIDLFKRNITLTEERRNHILYRSEMIDQENKIQEVLINPESIKRSVSDEKIESRKVN